jgi:Spy/CpxP family protein refolding chaperone
MRTLMALVMLLVGVAVFAAFPASADQKADEKAAMGLAERIQDLSLTDEQEANIADIRKEYRPKVQEAGNKLRATVREEVEAIVAVIKG